MHSIVVGFWTCGGETDVRRRAGVSSREAEPEAYGEVVCMAGFRGIGLRADATLSSRAVESAAITSATSSASTSQATFCIRIRFRVPVEAVSTVFSRAEMGLLQRHDKGQDTGCRQSNLLTNYPRLAARFELRTSPMNPEANRYLRGIFSRAREKVPERLSLNSMK